MLVSQKEKFFLAGSRKKCNFAIEMEYKPLEEIPMNTKKITREEAMRRFQASLAKKKAFVAELEKSMREEYRKETGQEARYFSVL